MRETKFLLAVFTRNTLTATCGVFAGKKLCDRLRGEVLTTRRYINLRLPLPQVQVIQGEDSCELSASFKGRGCIGVIYGGGYNGYRSPTFWTTGYRTPHF